MKYLLVVSVVANLSGGEPMTKVMILDDPSKCPEAAQSILSQLDDPFAGTQKVSCRPLKRGKGV